MSEETPKKIKVDIEHLATFDVYDDEVGVQYRQDGYEGMSEVRVGIRTHGPVHYQRLILTVPRLHKLKAVLDKFLEVYEQEIGEE